MKSERRHELEHNSLDTELATIWKWLRKNSNRLLTVVLIVLIVIVGYLWIQRSKETKMVEAQMNLSRLRREMRETKVEDTAGIVAGLSDLAANNDVQWVSAQAQLSLAEFYTSQAIAAKTDEDKTKALDNAKASYQRLVNDYSDRPVYVAAGKVGQGRVAEDQGNLKLARELYQSVVDDTALEGYPIQNIAQMSLEQVGNYRQETRLATTQPAWITAATSQPVKPIVPVVVPASIIETTEDVTVDMME